MANDITQTLLSLPTGPIRQLLVSEKNGVICGISMEFDTASYSENQSGLHRDVDDIAEQLNSYFIRAHTDWSADFAEIGTEFQRKVWRYLQSIPLGETQTYGDVAKALNSSARAVGNACRANPFLLVVPCHRVVKSTGLGGFAGQIDGEAIAIKQWLLDHEKHATR